MIDLKSYINESYTNGQLDKTVKKPERKRVHTAIYDALEESGVTGKLYRDESWEGVRAVKKICANALKILNNKLDGFKYEIIIAPDNGGYRKSNDGISQWKQYKVEIYKNPTDSKEHPEPFMIGTLNCHAAGSIKDPFDAYDMSFCISY